MAVPLASSGASVSPATWVKLRAQWERTPGSVSPAGGSLRPGIWVSFLPQELLLLGAGPGELDPRPAAHSNRDSNPEPEQPVRGKRQKQMGMAGRVWL